MFTAGKISIIYRDSHLHSGWRHGVFESAQQATNRTQKNTFKYPVDAAILHTFFKSGNLWRKRNKNWTSSWVESMEVTKDPFCPEARLICLLFCPARQDKVHQVIDNGGFLGLSSTLTPYMQTFTHIQDHTTEDAHFTVFIAKRCKQHQSTTIHIFFYLITQLTNN